MKIIISHIEYLLTEHDCVIVPGFGGFVVQSIDAYFSENGAFPPSREICFNAGLTHDDGLLISDIALVRGVDYAEARRLMVNELEIFKAGLSTDSTSELGSIGRFSIDNDHNLLFETSRQKYSHIETFGFQSMKLPLLSTLSVREDEVKAVEVNADVIQIRFSKRKALRVAASVAAVWLLWVFSTPVSDKQSIVSCAGLLNRAELMQVIQKYNNVVAVDTIQKTDTVIAKAEPKKIEPKETKPKVATETTVAKAAVADGAKEEMKYFVVLGSFQTDKKAELHCEQLKAQGIKDVKAKKMGSMIRTYLKAFSDKSKADSFVHSIRYDRDEYNQAWVYCMK